MLGRLGMTVGQCLREYEHLGEKVFGSPHYFHVRSFPFVLWRPKYSSKPLEEVIKRVVEKHDPKGEDAQYLQDNQDMCKT